MTNTLIDKLQVMKDKQSRRRTVPKETETNIFYAGMSRNFAVLQTYKSYFYKWSETSIVRPPLVLEERSEYWRSLIIDLRQRWNRKHVRKSVVVEIQLLCVHWIKKLVARRKLGILQICYYDRVTLTSRCRSIWNMKSSILSIRVSYELDKYTVTRTIEGATTIDIHIVIRYAWSWKKNIFQLM